MLHIVNRHNRISYPELLDRMHRDRKRVFVDTLRWDVPHDGTREADEFDDEHAEYLIIQDSATGDHLGSLRLLRTDRPHILGNLFPELCEGPVPNGPQIREITRLCLSPRFGATRRVAARNALARGLVEHGLLSGITTYTGVAEIRWLTQILSAGWRCMPLGLPQMIAGSMLGGLRIDITPWTLGSFAPSWRSAPTSYRRIETDLALAA